ncbi:hypothetical protein [Sneathiella chinensis]|uniref:Uncharacterized protein n=1 Tax=Sneathiella chinensis TaxID=349750 RepID=A0ABQ5U940_9PROT|nr:hypothetical protein [Sneathiella chinensis]GLQ07941.1 hypothetical protein GCM10007924_31630 [Sneathiella chinensis]
MVNRKILIIGAVLAAVVLVAGGIYQFLGSGLTEAELKLELQKQISEAIGGDDVSVGPVTLDTFAGEGTVRELTIHKKIADKGTVFIHFAKIGFKYNPWSHYFGPVELETIEVANVYSMFDVRATGNGLEAFLTYLGARSASPRDQGGPRFTAESVKIGKAKLEANLKISNRTVRHLLTMDPWVSGPLVKEGGFTVSELIKEGMGQYGSRLVKKTSKLNDLVQVR